MKVKDHENKRQWEGREIFCKKSEFGPRLSTLFCPKLSSCFSDFRGGGIILKKMVESRRGRLRNCRGAIGRTEDVRRGGMLAHKHGTGKSQREEEGESQHVCLGVPGPP